MNMEKVDFKTNLSKDGKTLIIQIPVKFQKRGGRKLIFSPDGELVEGPLRANLDDVLVNALAQAHRWKNMIESGKYDSITQLAEAEGVDRGNMSRMLGMTLLAPDITQAILDGKQPEKLTITELKKPFPLVWEEQRKLWGMG
ncbi:MAG: hypothetical protein HQL78_12525 [Magnetococcales bacterium]|nr:hypothetical protein [Magnetococcales bacterium]